METMQWSVAQIFSKRAKWIQRDIKAAGLTHFQPTYIRRWYVGGVESERKRPLIPGYMFVEDGGPKLRDVEELDGVIRVLGPIRGGAQNHAFCRMYLASETGAYNEVEAAPVEPSTEPKPVRRKPRRSLRLKRRLALQEAA